MENPTTPSAPSSSPSSSPPTSSLSHSVTASLPSSGPILPPPVIPVTLPNWNNIPPTPKPVSNLLAAFQATLSGDLAGRSLLDPEVQAATTTYKTLFYLSTMERAAEACDNVGQNAFKLTPLLRELNKAQSLNDRATARTHRAQRDKEKEAARLEREKERTHRRIIEMEHKERIEAIKLRRSECELQRVLARPAFKQRAADNKELRKPKSTRGKPKHKAAPPLDPSIVPSDHLPESDPIYSPDLTSDSAVLPSPDSFSEISNLKSAIPPSPPEAPQPPTSSPDPIASPTPAPVPVPIPPESSGGENLLPAPSAESTPTSSSTSDSASEISNLKSAISSSSSSSDRTPDSPPSPPASSLSDCVTPSLPSSPAPENPTTESVRSARENTYENEKTESKPQDPPPEELDPNRPTRRRISPEQAAAERDEIRRRLKPHLRPQFAWLDEFEEEDAKYRVRRQPIIRNDVKQYSYLR